MRKCKILFCTPPYHPYNLADEKVYVVEPIQFEVLASLLDISRFEVQVLDMRLERNKGSYLSKIKSFQPDIIGFTAWSMHVGIVKYLLSIAKRWNNKVITIVGGHHAGIKPNDFAIEEIDYILMGEAYSSFPELMSLLSQGERDASNIVGIAQKNNNRFVSSGKTALPPTFELDKLPFPKRDIVQRYLPQYFHLWWKPIASLRTSIGCPSRCSFCNLWRSNHGRYLTWSSDYVVEYLKMLDEHYILFTDDHFFGDIGRAYEIGEKILKNNIKKHFCLYSRADAITANPELVKLWGKIGLKRVRMGLETYTDDELGEMHKKSSIRDNDQAIKILKENDILTEGLFMIRTDYQKKQFDQLAEYIKKREIEVPNITVATPMPGTQGYKEIEQELVYHHYEYFDFQHAVLKTCLDLKTFYRLYCELMVKVQRPPYEQFKAIGIKKFIQRMPDFWRYFFSLKDAHNHYSVSPEAHYNRIAEDQYHLKLSNSKPLPWIDVKNNSCEEFSMGTELINSLIN